MINKITLIGRAGSDVRFTSLRDGRNAASFQMATWEFYKDAEGKNKKITEWHNIVAYGAMADIVKKLVTKGHLFHIEGKNKTRSYEKNGATHYITEVYVSSLHYLAPPSNGEDEGNG